MACILAFWVAGVSRSAGPDQELFRCHRFTRRAGERVKHLSRRMKLELIYGGESVPAIVLRRLGLHRVFGQNSICRSPHFGFTGPVREVALRLYWRLVLSNPRPSLLTCIASLLMGRSPHRMAKLIGSKYIHNQQATPLVMPLRCERWQPGSCGTRSFRFRLNPY
jgi:hypothetical protein